VCDESGKGAIELVLEGRPRDVGGFAVRRALPARERRMVGPFIFLDEMGRAELAAGQGIDVRPHPHIGLGTLTYLFEGEIMHRDSLGNAQVIRPGDVNFMLAGRGIAHSERSTPEARRRGGPVHGLQCWVALPAAGEEAAPRFEHHPAPALPAVRLAGVELRVLAGSAYGVAAPVGVLSPTFYIDAALAGGSSLALPDDHAERAAYVAGGTIACEGRRVGAGTLLVFRPGAEAVVRTEAPARLVLLGGAPLEGERHIWWNFVSSSRARIDRAKEDWREGRFPSVVGDDDAIPLPAG
jgi:hypothetical protein